MGGIYDSMNEKLIASEIKEALEMLECATNLSPADFTIIKAMINGKFGCAGCRHIAFCSLRGAPYFMKFCDGWQPKEGGE